MKVPISIEDLIKKRKDDENDSKKIVFLSKEERTRIALEKRAQAVQETKKVIESGRPKTTDFFSSLASNDTSAPMDTNKKRDSFDSQRRDSRKNNDRWGKAKDYENDTKQNTEKDSNTELKQDVQLKDQELQYIRDRYVGGKPAKKRLRKMNDQKFVFDWDAQEDTSQDINPLYQEKHSAQLFGRGHIAGIDPTEQKKNAERFYKDVSSLQKDHDAHPIKREPTRKSTFDDRHWSEKALDKMTTRDWRIFKEDYSISVKGTHLPSPIRYWKESGLPKQILDVIDSIGYKEPTPIQRQAIPIAIQNRDIIGVAETGSGKTASFVIPMLCFIRDLPPLDQLNSHLGPYALILAPTRELALQIETEANKFAKAMGFICVSIVGGRSIESQTTNLLSGAHIIIATPGRLRDCIDRRILALAQCTYVVMDEADRMIDLGFEADLTFILGSMPASNLKPDVDEAENPTWLESQKRSKNPYRQTVMFSATMPPAIEKLAKEYLRRPVNVTVGNVGQVVDRIEQRVEMVNDEGRKLNRLQAILRSGEFDSPIIVFVNRKHTCDTVARSIEKCGFRCAVLHGGKSQDQRESSLASLKSGAKDVLVATDVAGRGIDVKNVSLVVNFDMAKNIEEYKHRIGRTGRAGKNGCSITFLANYDTDVYFDLRMLLKASPLSVIPQELLRHEDAQVKPGTEQVKRKKDETLFAK